MHHLVYRVLDAYGARRLMWASDHTQQLARDRARYPEEVQLVRAALADLPPSDVDAVLGGNACRYLGWPAGVESTALAGRAESERSP